MIGLWFMNSLLIIVPEGAPLALNLIHIRAESWQLGCRPCRWGNGLVPALRSSLLPSDVTYYLDVKTSRQCGRRATRCVAYIEVWVKSWVHEIKKWSFKWANSWPLEMLTPTSLPHWCQRVCREMRNVGDDCHGSLGPNAWTHSQRMIPANMLGDLEHLWVKRRYTPMKRVA